MASGKSTVSELLAARFGRGVHVRGDVFRRMIVAGRDPITPALGDEARRQLALRWRLAATVANAYWAQGFAVVVQDLYPGSSLEQMVDLLDAVPLHVVVLLPRPDVVAARERLRGKVGYAHGWDVATHCAEFASATPRVGLWLDTSDDAPAGTVERILTAQGSRVR
jgi:hypothetical protein